jgi:alpha-glucosidase (family GH31 glycosyl hydrolase)
LVRGWSFEGGVVPHGFRLRRPGQAAFWLIVVPVTSAAMIGGIGRTGAPPGSPIVLEAPGYRVRIDPAGFRYGVERRDGTVIAAPHSESGLQILDERGGGGAVLSTSDVNTTSRGLDATVRTRDGLEARVSLAIVQTGFRMSVRPAVDGRYTIVARTGGVAPAFGLADHAAFNRATTELTGFTHDRLRAASEGSGAVRLVSNFVIAPRQGLASVNVHPGLKVVRVRNDELAQGSRDVRELSALHYFVGTPTEIYRQFLAIRNASGYKVYPPKYEWFGVGGEAWGALAWDTNQRTVTENVSRYLDLGFPLRWMVIGSGFWPRDDPRFHATTSFGLWDPNLYPDPRRLIEHFHQRGLKVMLGLRIAFIPDGPFAHEGVGRGFFLTEHGTPARFTIGFPRVPAYLLDAFRPGAVGWYVGLCQKWLDFGIDGFKEDLYGFGTYDLRDDKIDPVNAALMDRGVYIMGRNAYLGSPVDLHRYNDFNYWETQDRGPINGLALAYSGFPYVYPDIVGGTIAATETQGKRTLSDAALKQYLMRYARYGSVHPSMSVGYGPWNLHDEQVSRVMLESAQLHGRLHPYIYSAAVATHRTGFPHTMTPLPLAFPDDPAVYHLENAVRRGYQWLIGDALMAIPLYGDDYATATARDVYLPRGRWIEYDTGAVHEGPATLSAFTIPVTRNPLLVGGTGIIVEERQGRLLARVYPVNPNAATVFHHKDGRDTSIRVQVGAWGAPAEVATDGGRRVEATQDDVALTFAIEPGISYRVRPASGRR